MLQVLDLRDEALRLLSEITLNIDWTGRLLDLVKELVPFVFAVLGHAVSLLGCGNLCLQPRHIFAIRRRLYIVIHL